MGKDGYPVIWMKFSRNDDSKVEMKPYRVSFVRAALLVSEAHQEAQLQVSVNMYVSAVYAKPRLIAATSAFYHASNPAPRRMPLKH